MTRLTLTNTFVAAVLASQATGFAPIVPTSTTTSRSQAPSMALPDALGGLGSLDQTQLVEAGVVLVAAAAAAAAVALQGDGEGDSAQEAAPPEPEPEPIDVSIPYDAAARLAYDEWRSGKFDEVDYQKFKEVYELKSVAEVTASRYARELAGLQESS